MSEGHVFPVKRAVHLRSKVIWNLPMCCIYDP